MRNLMLLGLVCFGTTGVGLAQEATPTKVTVRLGGVVCGQCAASIREAIGKVPGVSFDASAIEPGAKPRYFSEPFELTLEDTGKADLGDIARAVAGANTPHRSQASPHLFLTLFGIVDEPKVTQLRAALLNVGGVDANGSGTIGGVPQEDTFWVRLEGTGQARLAEIRGAVEKGVRYGVTLDRP